MRSSASLGEKRHRLEELIRSFGRVLVAFSGGVDSSFLLAFCANVRGAPNVTAVIGDSETLARRELEQARNFASAVGVSLLQIDTGELEDDRFLMNPEDRCYYCKSDLFGRLKAIALEEGVDTVVLDGTNLDDIQDHRPGRRAASELGIRSPLAEAGLTKNEVRLLSREMGLSTWDKPAMACLASRFPYGQKITRAALNRVERAEDILRQLGFSNVRVRDHDGLARIEVDQEEIPRLLTHSVDSLLKPLGFDFVTVDLEGFRSGSLNRRGGS